MKRSEMIKKVSNISGNDYESINIILGILEKEGMLPPRNPNITFAQQAEHKTLHIWEEE